MRWTAKGSANVFHLLCDLHVSICWETHRRETVQLSMYVSMTVLLKTRRCGHAAKDTLRKVYSQSDKEALTCRPVPG